MARELTVQVPTWVETKVSVPDSCPECGASFLEGHNLIEINLDAVLMFGNIHTHAERFSADGDQEACLDFTVTGYQCGACRQWEVP